MNNNFENKELMMLNSFNLEALEENIDYFRRCDGAAEWKDGPTQSGENRFTYPVYHEGMNLPAIIESLGGFDEDYNEHMKQIGQAGLNPTDLNSAQIRSLLTYIVRGEKFCDGHIDGFMKNLVLLKLCLRLDDLVSGAMTKENPRSYSFAYIKSLGVQRADDENRWIFKAALDESGDWSLLVEFDDDGSFVKFSVEGEELLCELTDDSELRAIVSPENLIKSEKKLTHQLLSEYIAKNGAEALRGFVLKKVKQAGYKGYDYYSLGSGLVFKINTEEMKCYRLNPEAKTWKEDPSLFCDFESGSIVDYKEIWLNEDYEIEAEVIDDVPRKGPQILIGRKSACDLQIADSYVSGNHALMYYNGEQWMIRDLNSTNGTKVNGEAVSVSAIRDGDKITLGQCDIDFCEQYITIKDEKMYLYDRSVMNRMLDVTKLSRYQGCLLGGAVGDALGYLVEFWNEEQIFEKFGAEGIGALEQAGNPALISDDTQMSLFAANALICAESNADSVLADLKTAYREWLATQGEAYGMNEGEQSKMWVYDDKRMHALRAPGNTCISSIRAYSTNSDIQCAENDSKGCGTVMRAAPMGLFVTNNPNFVGDAQQYIYNIAKYDAMLTHGHPAAHASSIALALIIFNIVQGKNTGVLTLEEIISTIKTENEEVDSIVEKAVCLANNGAVSDIDAIDELGEGWVAEQALAIAVFCAVRYQNDFAKAIRTAVNHKGDSDSTGAICGNILGAWLGRDAVESAFNVENLELADIVIEIATDLYRCVEKVVPAPMRDEKWDRKYRRIN